MLLTATHLRHQYGKVTALRDVSLNLQAGSSVAFIGPDGVGKSTLLALMAGAKRLQDGTLEIMGGDVRSAATRSMLQQRVAYMPQGLGRNLYADLSIRENLEFFARLYGQGRAERRQRIELLTRATGLYPFLDRPAGKLSGGMKQKLGLCCALIHDPELIILDEPTTGVDPLSRKQFWELINRIRHLHPGLTVVIATSYMEEAEAFDHVVMMNDGCIIAQGTAQELKQRSGEDDLERAFITFLPDELRASHEVPQVQQRDLSGQPIAIAARDLTRRFGDFTAVDHVSFDIPRGEIFGFLGSNGCGKTTTMKMLTGLLPVSEGRSSLLGQELVAGDMENRRRIGYMSQSFSLYGELTVAQNLWLHANLFHLPREEARQRIDWIYERFDLARFQDQNSGQLPLGVRQRLSLAVAVIHSPEVLILDEPTSGVDPVARDNFWSLLLELSRQDQVTIFVSTHFMNEAARCDRISFMHAGRVLATGTPAQLREGKQVSSLNDAFIAYLEEAAGYDMPAESELRKVVELAQAAPDDKPSNFFSITRMLAYTQREIMEMLRDPVRLTVATLGMAVLMMVFAYGITLDVNSLRYAALDLDQTVDSQAYLHEIEGSTYFITKPPIESPQAVNDRLRSGSVSLALEIPPNFGRDLHAGRQPQIGAWIDGSLPYRAEMIGGYLEGLHQRYLQVQGLQPSLPLTIESRYLYNQGFRSLNTIAPSVIGLLLVFIPAILSALAVVREKELGSIANMYVTPVTRLEFLLGKQIPYVLFAMFGFVIVLLLTVLVFQVPVKGSLLALLVGTLLYVICTTGIGMFISSFTSSQVAALFGVAICTMMPASQFSGMLQPVPTLEGSAYWIGTFYPTTYYLKTTVGAFTKGLDYMEMQPFLLALLAFAPAIVLCNALLLKKQER